MGTEPRNYSLYRLSLKLGHRPEGGTLRRHPSYVSVTIVSNRVVATEWIDPGQLPDAVLTQPLVPYQRDSLHGAQERFADFRSSGASAKLYGCGWLLIQNPQHPETPFQFLVEPSRRYRAKSAYLTYGFVLVGAVVFDAVAASIELIGIYLERKMFCWDG